MDQSTIDKLKKNPDFKKFIKYIGEEIKELEHFENMENIEEMSDKKAGEEIKARKRAVGILVEIFKKFKLKERSENTPEEIKKAQKGYGL